MSKKKEILKAATLLFATNGFIETSMTEVAKMTGTASATIFYHFKSKEDLFLAVLNSVKDGILDEFSHYFGEKKFTTGFEMLEGTVSFYLYLAGNKAEWFLLLHRYYPYKLAKENNACRQSLEDIYNCFVDIFEKALVQGQADGSIGKLSPRKTALLILSTVDGMVRFKNCDLYDAGALYNELIATIRRMAANQNQKI
jgi:AcrR family transcriptional regulator